MIVACNLRRNRPGPPIASSWIATFFASAGSSLAIGLCEVVCPSTKICGGVNSLTPSTTSWNNTAERGRIDMPAANVCPVVKLECYDALCAEAFRCTAAAPPKRKLAELLAPKLKLPGVGAPSGSTIFHFILKVCQSSMCAPSEYYVKRALLKPNRATWSNTRNFDRLSKKKAKSSLLDLTRNRQSTLRLPQASAR